jgi:AcrR family transcriptional regulator
MSATVSSKEDIVQQQILAVAKRLFQVYGLAKVTMEDVAKAIGKGRSSLYYYYKSKDEIYNAVVMMEIREMLTVMTQAVDQAGGFEAKLRAFFLSKLAIVREKSTFFKMLDVGMDADALSEFKKAMVVHHNLIIRQEGALLAQLLGDAMQKGEMRPMNAADVETLILVLLSCLRGIKRELELERNAKKDIPAVEMFIQMAMNGIKA